MAFLADLWLPIILASVLVFVVSSIIHMATPMHKGDKQGIPGEVAVLEGMHSANIPPGDYMFPFCNDMKEMGSDEMIAKYKKGPVGFMTILPPGPPAIGKNLVLWFIYSLVISLFVAYIASLGLSAGAEYMKVFRMTGAVAVLAYALADIPTSIWWGSSWKTTFKFFIDGVIYGLVTAGTFAWLWPDA